MISIIIPMYNSSKTIKKCLDKIINQDINNIEIVLIDDNSIDNTYSICSEYLEKYKFIKLYKNPKKGVSSARNYGIKKSKGEYIVFLDSDDFLTDNALEIIKSNLNSDMIIYGFSFVNKKLEIMKTVIDSQYCISREEFINNKLLLYVENSLLYSVWNKVFVKKIIDENRILFNEKFNFNEDILFCLNYLKFCDNISNIDEPLYLYVCDTNGLSKKYNTNNYYSLNEYYDETIMIYKKDNDKYLNKIFFEKILEDINKLSISLIKKSERIKLLKFIRNSEMFKKTSHYAKVNLKNTIIKNLMLMRMYRLVIFLYKINNRINGGNYEK